jgi:hypothetical protein
MLMTLVLKPIESVGPERFYVYDGERRIGRIFKADKDLWSWGIDWFAIGQKLLANHPGTREEATAAVKTMWQLVTRSGVEIIGKGQAFSRDEALEMLEAAWRHVLAGGQARCDE